MTYASHDVMVTTSNVSNGVKFHSTEHAIGKNRIFEDTKITGRHAI